MPLKRYEEEVAPNEEKREVFAFRCAACGSLMSSSSPDCPKCKGEMLGSIRMTPHRIVIFAVVLTAGILAIQYATKFWSSSGTTNSKSSSVNYNTFSTSTYNSNYQHTPPSYNTNAPLLPRHKGDIEPLYNEVQRLKREHGMTDAEAVDKVLRDAGEIP